MSITGISGNTARTNNLSSDRSKLQSPAKLTSKATPPKDSVGVVARSAAEPARVTRLASRSNGGISGGTERAALEAKMKSTDVSVPGAVTSATTRNPATTDVANADLMTRGARGPEVAQLQQSLIDRGVNPGPVDGKFGPLTAGGVREFQRQNGLQVDGIVGPQTRAALDGTSPSPSNVRPVDANPAASTVAGNRTATFDSVSNAGQRNQMVTGKITVNGNSYDFRSGGGGRGNLPAGQYEVTPHMWNRSDRSMNVGGEGYSFALSDKYDPRVGGTRSLLRIHPDGGSAGTIGCIGVVGNAATQRQFREDMRQELERNGGRFTLNVG